MIPVVLCEDVCPFPATICHAIRNHDANPEGNGLSRNVLLEQSLIHNAIRRLHHS
jgi:hypothetical protein